MGWRTKSFSARSSGAKTFHIQSSFHIQGPRCGGTDQDCFEGKKSCFFGCCARSVVNEQHLQRVAYRRGQVGSWDNQIQSNWCTKGPRGKRLGSKLFALRYPGFQMTQAKGKNRPFPPHLLLHKLNINFKHHKTPAKRLRNCFLYFVCAVNFSCSRNDGKYARQQ